MTLHMMKPAMSRGECKLLSSHGYVLSHNGACVAISVKAVRFRN